MYFRIVKEIVDEGINDYAAAYGSSRDEVLSRIRFFIDETSKQHQKAEPIINYGDPLCRLGYLYRHAGLQATLFERVLAGDTMTQDVITSSVKAEKLTVCSLGGGPGTELLGLTKFLSRQAKKVPPRIEFTVLDNVNHWAETWKQLAKAAERTFEAQFGKGQVIVEQNFLKDDALDPSTYIGYPSFFKEVNLVVCNYLFSENQTKLDEAGQAISNLAHIVSDGCIFVVIDRLEQNTNFVKKVEELFQSLFGQVQVQHLAGIMDPDEQVSELGDELREKLEYPRLKFRTRHYGSPTAFWFTVQK